jgi:DNA ligase-1
MLSATLEERDIPKLSFPYLVSPKLDGIRATIINERLVSRSGKPIQNAYVRACLEGHEEWDGLDGELIVGSPTAPDVFRVTSSGIMSRDGLPDFKFYVFDHYGPGQFQFRVQHAQKWAKNEVVWVPHELVHTPEGLERIEEMYLEQGYEGIMLRHPKALYKNGRSTMREQGLMKLKRFYDSEAEVIGVEERMHNGNEATVDALGYTERSTHRENLSGRGDLGALQVRDLKTGVEFAIGTGFDDHTRATLWKSPPIGRIAKYKYFPTGSKERPRFPVFIGFRSPEDM